MRAFATNRLEELKSCYENLIHFKKFITILCAGLLHSDGKIEIAYHNGVESPSFDVIVPLGGPGTNYFINHSYLFNEQLLKYKMTTKGHNYFFLNNCLQIVNCNPLIHLFKSRSKDKYYNIAEKIQPILMGQEAKNTFLPPIDNDRFFEVKNNRPLRGIPAPKQIRVEEGRNLYHAQLFAPTLPNEITRIEWNHHLPFDANGGQDSIYYPLRHADGRIRDFALLLNMDDEKLNKKFSAILDRGKVIHTQQASGNHIRRLTKNEVAAIERSKPGLTHLGEKIYNGEMKLELTYKLCFDDDIRLYGFRMLGETPKIYYRDGSTSDDQVNLIVFCVVDCDAHKAHRSAGIFAATSDPYLKAPNPGMEMRS